jgi:hypothetical protein
VLTARREDEREAAETPETSYTTHEKTNKLLLCNDFDFDFAFDFDFTSPPGTAAR